MDHNKRAEDTGAEYLSQAQALGPVLATNADAIEQNGELPGPLVAILRDKRFFRLLQPRSIGGLELDPVSYVPIIEQIASHDASTAWCLGQNNGCSMTAAYLEPAVAKDIFGPDDGILAWGPGPATIERVRGGYRLSGKWSFASGSHHASWLGAHVPGPDGDGAIRTLLFPKSSAKMKAIWRVVGLRGTGSDAYSVADLFVPEEYTVLRGPGIRARETGTLYSFTRGNLYAAGFAGVALGIARGMLAAFVELASEKVPRGTKGTLRENAAIQALVAESEAKLRASRSFLMDTLHQMWSEAEARGAFTAAQGAMPRLASTWAIHQARDAATALYQAAGATAIFNENPFERRFRDMHTACQQSQGRPVHLQSVGQILLGLEPQTALFTF